MEADVKQELAEAKALIQQKRYEEARSVLIMIDHPTADKWLERLNEILATQDNMSIVPDEKENKSPSCFTFFAGVAILGALCFWLLGIPDGNNAPSTAPNPAPTNPAPTNPEEAVREALADVAVYSDDIDELRISSSLIHIQYELGYTRTSTTVSNTANRFVRLACKLRDAGLNQPRYLFSVVDDVVSTSGDSQEIVIIEATLRAETVARFDCENTLRVNLPAIADDWFVHFVLR